MKNLLPSEIDALASRLMNTSNNFGVPYFQGYHNHVVELIKQVQLEIAKKN